MTGEGRALSLDPPAWSLVHEMRISAVFPLLLLCCRRGNRLGDGEGVYLVGGGTHPGSGLPVIYEGARITSGLLARDLGLRPVPAGTGFSTDMTPAYGATS